MIEKGSLVFLDTAVLVALVDNTDSLYQAATRTMGECRKKRVWFYVTDMVLVEFLNALSSIRFRKSAIGFADALRSSRRVTTIWVNSAVFNGAWDMYRHRADKSWSLTDCASFVIMKERGISIAFTSDKHFEQAGFVRLLDSQ